MFKDKSLEQYLNLLASNNHIPGGGTISALNSASACSLILMAINFTVGKKEYISYTDYLNELKTKSENLQSRFIELIDLDSQAYDTVTKSYKIPKNDPERDQKIQEAYKQSLDIPFTVFGLIYDYFGKVSDIVNFINKNLLSDVYIAMTQIKAALYSSRINIMINAKYIEDKCFVLRKTSNIDQMLSNFESRYIEVTKKLDEQMGII